MTCCYMQNAETMHRHMRGNIERWIGLFPILILAICAWDVKAQEFPINVRFETGCSGVKAFFTHDLAVSQQTWDLGDGTITHVPAPVHEFPPNTVINVTLTVQDASGNEQIHALDVSTPSLIAPADLVFPNVFSPNGDGINDIFAPIGDPTLGPCSSLSIFNRFGQRIFFGEGITVIWDGRTFAGERAVEGTYFYVFTMSGIEFTGHITLHL